MEPSTIRKSTQESAKEPATRRRVRNWRNKLPKPQTQTTTFNNITSDAINNIPELDVKVKPLPKSNDEIQKFQKFDAVAKTAKTTTVKQKDEILVKNEQTLSKLKIQTSSNIAIPNNIIQGSPKSNSQNSPKLSEKNISNHISPKPNVQELPAKIGGQVSPKTNVQAPPLPVVRGKYSPKSNGQISLTKLNDQNSSGSKSKRRRYKGASLKKDITENQPNSQHLKSNDFDEASKLMNDQKIVVFKKDEDMENQSAPTTIVGKNEETKTDVSSNNQPISGKMVNDQVPVVEKNEVVEQMKEDIDNKKIRNTTIDKDQDCLNKYTDFAVVIERDKFGVEQQITSISITESEVIEETNSSDIQNLSVKDKKEIVQESQLEDSAIKKTEEKKVELISSNELSSKAEEESVATTDETSPSAFVKKFKEPVIDNDENDTQRERVEIPSVCATELQGTSKRGLPAGCLFVASLPSIKSDGELHKSVWNHFSRWGILLNVKVLKDWLFRPYSFVQFENVCDARRALVEAHNTVIEGRHIRVEQARVNRTLFIGRLNRSMSEEDIRKLLEPYGATEDIHLLRTYSTGKSKGCAFVKFCYRDDAIRAYMNLRQNTSNYVIEWAANLEKAVPGPEDIDKRSIFVGQLNQVEVTKESLVEKFGCYGRIREVQYIVRKFFRTIGPPRSAFAFIYYNDEEASRKAIEAENNTRYFDRTIRVQYRESQEFRNQQIQLLRQQQEVRRKAFQESYYNVPIRPPPLSRAQNYYVSAQKTSIGQGRRNSIIPKEMPIISAPVFYPQVSVGIHKVNTNGNKELKGKGPEVTSMQNNTVSNMRQPELMYYPPPTSIPTSVGMIPAYSGSPREGLTYPYAPSMTFMGAINHNNGTSYTRDGPGHETTSSTTVSKAPLASNILHSYVPPYVSGQPVNEYGHSAQYCGIPIPIQITMQPPMYFYPSPPIDPGYTISHLQTLEEPTSGYEADTEIHTQEKAAIGEIAKEEGPSSSKAAAQEPVAI
ncbi:hypothetical protein C1645_741312 [Glomus cerebriforme]|uniref:RRM domain-containing protein n=1 Tax=Glomus cerebriforme TaxID=658196 RepID=A0A397SIC4_9GLOM|nr:hypothetical protein C1645_741312 [Glomus cerebriforme]